MKINPGLKEDLKSYIKRRLAEEGVTVYVMIVAPYMLGDEEITLLKNKIPELKAAKIVTEVDPDIMAGILIKYGSSVIDLSLKTQLQTFAQTLYETA